MPDLSWRSAAKFWVALVGVICSTVVAAAPEVPQWVSVVAAVATAVAVYLVPQVPGSKDGDGPS